MLCKLWITLPLHSLLPVHTVRHNNNLSKAAVPEKKKKKNHNVSDWTTNFGSESVSFSPVMMDTVYIVLFFTYLYFPIYALQKQTNLEVLQAWKRKVFLRRNFIRKQSGTWRSADMKTLDAARRTEEQKQESSFALFTVPGYLISRSLEMFFIQSRHWMQKENRTWSDPRIWRLGLETYGQDGKYKYMLL